ncbi:hypothetical protein [Marichromatium sp. AB32]|uniref:hypothetical protein n=1 Tax=Marichromatium sp. AB32 TaxID=2483363 RepID=UPI0016813CC4
MTQTLAFDVYGTLIDTHGLIPALTPLVGEAAPAFSRECWRSVNGQVAFCDFSPGAASRSDLGWQSQVHVFIRLQRLYDEALPCR